LIPVVWRSATAASLAICIQVEKGSKPKPRPPQNPFVLGGGVRAK